MLQSKPGMKKTIYLFVILLMGLTACEKKEKTPDPSKNDQTVFIYMPWADNLLSEFYTNIADFESAIKSGILNNERVIVFLHTSATEATLFELKYYKGNSIRETIQHYENVPFTTSDGIASILNDVITAAPARRYAMIIGCHGMGWLPKTVTRAQSTSEKEYWEYEGVPKTRWFGGSSSQNRTEIAALAEGIAKMNLKMEYILFDDCYMSSIEVAYDLRHVTDYVIGCPTEVMAYGMPYAKMAPHLVGTVNYEGVAETFLEFYKSYKTPCGTIGTTVCAELENLAAVMRKINRAYTFDTSLIKSVQTMDGYTPTRFFDLGDYVRNLCKDQDLLNEFETQLERTLPSAYKRHTTYYYTAKDWGKQIKIDSYSGTTTSDPSISAATATKAGTAWYQATH